MSGPPDISSSSFSTAGYEDGFGRRSVRFNREVGGMLECLHLRPQFVVFEPALRARAEALARLEDERFALVRAFEKDATGLRVISDLVAGQRLVDVLETRGDDSSVSGIDAAFGFLLQAMPALAQLHANSITHGAVAPGRIVITPNSQVVLLDNIYGSALERLNPSRSTLWMSFGVMAAPASRAMSLDRSADVGQVALCALLLALGRPLDGSASVAALVPLVREIAELAEIRAGSHFAEGVGRFFIDTLPAVGKRRTMEADEATAAIRRLLPHISEDESLNALAELVSYRPVSARPRSDSPVSVVDVVAPIREPVPAPVPEPVFVAPVPVPAAAAAVSFTQYIPPPAVEVKDEQEEQPTAPSVPAWDPIPSLPAAVQPPVAVPPAPPAPAAFHPARPVFAQAPPPVAVPEPPAFQAPVPLFVAAAPPVFAPPPTPVAVQPPPMPVQPPPMPLQPPRIPVGPPMMAHAPIVPAIAPATIAPQPSPAVLKIRQDGPAGYAPIRVRDGETASHAEPTARALSFLDRAAEPAGGFPWKIAAAVAIVVIVGGVAGRDYLRGPSDPAPVTKAAAPAPAPVAASTTTGGLVIDSQPSGAKVTLDGKEVGTTPLTLDEVKVGRHQVTVTSGSALVQRSIRIEAGKQSTLNVPVFSGWVAIFSPIRLEVSAGRRSLGSTEDGKILLPPGKHVLTLSSVEFGYNHTETVEISPGEERVLNLRPTGMVNLNASPWAEVWVDGKRAGETPLANLEVPLGTREFVFKHPQFGERKLTAIVTTTASALSVDFGRPPSKP